MSYFINTSMPCATQIWLTFPFEVFLNVSNMWHFCLLFMLLLEIKFQIQKNSLTHEQYGLVSPATTKTHFPDFTLNGFFGFCLFFPLSLRSTIFWFASFFFFKLVCFPFSRVSFHASPSNCLITFIFILP